MKARSRGASSSTRASSTRSSRPIRSIRGAAAWVDRVGLAAVFPGADLVLPSLWEAVSGRLELDWAERDEEGGFVAFTPEMDKVWRWKDELPERGVTCVGRHLGRWSGLVAPRLVSHLHVAAAERREALTPFQHEVADAVRVEGPCTGPELRRLLAADKKQVDAAVLVLQRALVLTNSGLVEQEQGWGAIAVDLVERRWTVAPVAEPELELARTVLRSSGELSAADLGGALGWRLKASREALEQLVERGEGTRRDEHGLALWRGADLAAR